MPTYAIGDVQGCYEPLQRLLEKINFNNSVDQLWFVGDLVNRGPDSLAVLRFIKNLTNVKVVLGNHDLHLLALAHDYSYPHHTLQLILQAPDRDELLNWLQHQPLLHHDEKLNYVMVHAGIYPYWNLSQAKLYAKELEQALQKNSVELFQHMYGNLPDRWQDNLTGWDRLRFITNAFTRMRFCSPEGQLEFNSTEGLDKQPEGFFPWFLLPNRLAENSRIIFGHWAALQGKVNANNCFGLDTGCVWGNALTAMRLEDQQRFNVSCNK